MKNARKHTDSYGKGIYGCALCGTIIMPGTGTYKKCGPRGGKHLVHKKCKGKMVKSYREL